MTGRRIARYSHSGKARLLFISPCNPFPPLLELFLNQSLERWLTDSDPRTSMRAIRHRPCSPLLLGAVFAFLAGAMLAPSPAQAGCGDHALILSPKTNGPVLAPDLPVLPAKKHAPCSGPHCSRSPITPVTPPTTPVGPSGQEWACVLEPLLLPASNSSPFRQETPREHTHFLAAGVYHPPR